MFYHPNDTKPKCEKGDPARSSFLGKGEQSMALNLFSFPSSSNENVMWSPVSNRGVHFKNNKLFYQIIVSLRNKRNNLISFFTSFHREISF